MPFIQLDKVRKSFRREEAEPLTVLQDISFAVEEQEVVTLVGPSGCGKTTLLRLIAGLQAIDEGALTIAGRPSQLRPLSIGFVFQNFNLLPWRTVLENVVLPLELTSASRGQYERAAALVRQTGLHGFEDYLPDQLSEGMKQRTSLARALAVDPELLLLDEPLGAVDSLTREILRDELLEWIEGKRTVIHVTHDIEDALLLSDRILLLSQRPARVITEVPVPFARPRKPAELLARGEFGDLRTKLTALFRDRIGVEGILGPSTSSDAVRS